MDNIELSFAEPSSSQETEEAQDDDETTLTKDELITKLKEENIFSPKYTFHYELCLRDWCGVPSGCYHVLVCITP